MGSRAMLSSAVLLLAFGLLACAGQAQNAKSSADPASSTYGGQGPYKTGSPPGSYYNKGGSPPGAYGGSAPRAAPAPPAPPGSYSSSDPYYGSGSSPSSGYYRNGGEGPTPDPYYNRPGSGPSYGNSPSEPYYTYEGGPDSTYGNGPDRYGSGPDGPSYGNGPDSSYSGGPDSSYYGRKGGPDSSYYGGSKGGPSDGYSKGGPGDGYGPGKGGRKYGGGGGSSRYHSKGGPRGYHSKGGDSYDGPGHDDGYAPKAPKPGYGGHAGPFPNFQTFDKEDCINSINEYADAFNAGGVRRCVSDNILVRIDQYFDELENTTKDKMFANWFGGRRKSATFWSFGDNPEKYIRIGRSALTLGNYVDNPPGNVGLQDPKFPGIRDPKNFAALLEAIGYGSSDSNPKKAQLMVITERPRKNTVPTFVPTWGNVLKYVEWFVQLAATDPDAAAAAGINNAHLYTDFSFSKETRDILSTLSFYQLTNCSAQCTYQDTNFGSFPDPNPGDSVKRWTSATKNANHLADGTCDFNAPPFNETDPTRWEVTEPTIIDTYSPFCRKEFLDLQKLFNDNCKDRAKQNVLENRALALRMAREYMHEGNNITQALVLRSYLLTGCAGGYNPLFSGDGFTYTGNGGFLGATGTEIATGETLPDDMPKVFPHVRLIFFCPANDDGMFDKSTCPDSLKDFDLEEAAKLVDPDLDVSGWDVQEVVLEA